MKKTMIILIAICAAGNIFAQIQIQSGNVFEMLCIQKFDSSGEIMILFFNNGDCRILSTNDISYLNVKIGHLESILKNENKTLSDIAVIAHNHLKRAIQSDGDRQSLDELRKRGFAGEYWIYHVPSRTFRKW